MSTSLDEELISLRYYAKQQCSRQWVHFLAAMFGEFEERVDASEADHFLETIGSRMAQSLPLRRCESLEDLQDDINAVLEGMDWGWVRVAESGRFIEIVHGAYPLIPQDESRRSWLVPVLEGLYTEWLGEQGGDPAFTARLVEAPRGAGAPFAFHYGRHD
ncbi:MAG TPA: cellulose biosynthesis protein BcsD [Stellaceae bacterium]|nr:cellulose biosynthesis protein BcsD [Stellaceae bacterium]